MLSVFFSICVCVLWIYGVWIFSHVNVFRIYIFYVCEFFLYFYFMCLWIISIHIFYVCVCVIFCMFSSMYFCIFCCMYFCIFCCMYFSIFCCMYLCIFCFVFFRTFCCIYFCICFLYMFFVCIFFVYFVVSIFVCVSLYVFVCAFFVYVYFLYMFSRTGSYRLFHWELEKKKNHTRYITIDQSIVQTSFFTISNLTLQFSFHIFFSEKKSPFTIFIFIILEKQNTKKTSLISIKEIGTLSFLGTQKNDWAFLSFVYIKKRVFLSKSSIFHF